MEGRRSKREAILVALVGYVLPRYLAGVAAEPSEIAREVRKIAPKVQTTHVLFDNNYEDQGQRGARALNQILIFAKG